MHGLDLLLTLSGGLVAALICGYLTQRLGLSPIVGYLAAGVLIGPYTPGFVADVTLAQELAEIGVILLMFGVGLQLHLEDLLAVRRVAVPGALVQSGVATVLGALVTRIILGEAWTAALVFGVALAVASTVVLIRVLADNRDLHTPAGHIAVGWLVVEDLFTVVILVILPAIVGGGSASEGLAGALAITALKVTGLVGFTFVVGTRIIPWLLDRIAATGSRELFTLAVLAIALGIAVGSALGFGVSMALGAFLAGLVVGRSDYSLRAASDALPMRDAFAVLFFVSVGMLFDPWYLLEEPALVAATLGVVLVGKPVAALAVVLALRYPVRTALTVSVALAQIGEFSFILAALAIDLGLLPARAMSTVVAVAIISIVLNPILYRWIAPLEAWVVERPRLGRLGPGRQAPVALTPPPDPDHAHRAIVVGFGPTGRTLTRLLSENGIEPTVIELNLETVRALREQGVSAVYGDACHRSTLETAGVHRARNLLLTADLDSSEQVIRLAGEMNDRIYVLARTSHLRDVEALKRAGAHGVFSGEGEVALAMTETMLRRLGATPDQIDRERERVHRELKG
jgi:CPA2 family monovalent cation:H+ antiporter-2